MNAKEFEDLLNTHLQDIMQNVGVTGKSTFYNKSTASEAHSTLVKARFKPDIGLRMNLHDVWRKDEVAVDHLPQLQVISEKTTIPNKRNLQPLQTTHRVEQIVRMPSWYQLRGAAPTTGFY